MEVNRKRRFDHKQFFTNKVEEIYKSKKDITDEVKELKVKLFKDK